MIEMKMTFRELDGNVHTNPAASALDAWYERVRDVPLDALSIGDLCRAGRQRLFLECVVPLLVDQLTLNPHDGELYDGELISTLSRIPAAFWKQVPQLKENTMNIFMNELSGMDADIIEDARVFINSQ